MALIAFSLIVGPPAAVAEPETEETASTPPPAEATLAESPDTAAPEKPFLIRPYTGIASLDVTFRTDSGKKVQFSPNKPLFVGLKLAYKGYAIWGSTPVVTQSEATYGKSDSFDLQGGKGVRVMQRELFLEGFIQWYRGYYVENTKAIEPTMTGYLIQPNMSGFNLGVAGIYYFNRSFSHETTFSEMRPSPRSGGSWLIRAALGALGIASDDSSPFLPDAIRADFGQLASIHAFRSRYIGISAGYAYDWRMLRRLFLSGSICLGLSGALSTYRVAGSDDIWEAAFGGSGSILLAFGYAGETFHGGFAGTVSVEGMRSSSVNMEFSRYQLLLMAGARI